MGKPITVIAAALSAVSCGSGSGPDVDPDRGDTTGPAVCRIIDMRTADGLDGQELSPDDFARLQDPVARTLLRGGDGCPTTFEGIQDKITAAQPDCGPDRIHFGLISETTSLTGQANDFRTVFYRGEDFRDGACSQQRPSDLLISLFGLGPNTSAAAIRNKEVELIGFDQATGVFNYYAVEDLSASGSPVKGRAWRFFGSSHDFVRDGAGDGAFPNQVRRCASCHVGGGLVQKELRSPWLHWFGGNAVNVSSDDVPAMVRQFVAKAPDILGTAADPTGDDRKGGGNVLEFGVVELGNRGVSSFASQAESYTPARVEFIKKQGSVGDLLRPLFCTLEVNIQAPGVDDGCDKDLSAGRPLGEISALLVDGQLVSQQDPRCVSQDGQPPAIACQSNQEDERLLLSRNRIPELSLPIDGAIYRSVMKRARQRVVDGASKTADGRLTGGVVIGETTFERAPPDPSGGDLGCPRQGTIAFPERSLIDQAYVAELVDQGIVDAGFAQAVLMVDFTRPIFSDTRCELLDRLAERIPASTPRTAAAIRQAVTAALGASPPAGSAEARLAANLTRTASALEAEVIAFARACDRRRSDEPQALIEDIQAVVSARRNRARQMDVFEFSATLPVDDLQVAPDARLDPTSCQLTCTSPPCKRFP